MPVYEFKCSAGHWFDRYLKLAEYDAPQTCECGQPAARQISPPMVSVDIPAYQSPIDGRWVNSRAQRREDLARSGCVEYEPSLREHGEKQRAREDAALEAKMDATIESEIHAMPTRTREKLVAELEGGMDVQLTRTSPGA